MGLREHSKFLQMRLEQTESESAHSQSSFERMLDEEQQKVAEERGQIEQITRSCTKLKSQSLDLDEKLALMDSKLQGKASENETLINEASRKDREAHEAEVAVSTLLVKERDLSQTTADLDEDRVELKLQFAETEGIEQELHRSLVALQNENKLMRQQVAEKQKAERVLLLEIEAKRYHLEDHHGDSEADKHAAEAFEKMLHE